MELGAGLASGEMPQPQACVLYILRIGVVERLGELSQVCHRSGISPAPGRVCLWAISSTCGCSSPMHSIASCPSTESVSHAVQAVQALACSQANALILVCRMHWYMPVGLAGCAQDSVCPTYSLWTAILCVHHTQQWQG